MTGPEHYREAERLLARTVNESISDEGEDHYDCDDTKGGYDYSYLHAAQVHATLALAAATADRPIVRPLGTDGTAIARAWSEAIS